MKPSPPGPPPRQNIPPPPPRDSKSTRQSSHLKLQQVPRAAMKKFPPPPPPRTSHRSLGSNNTSHASSNNTKRLFMTLALCCAILVMNMPNINKDFKIMSEMRNYYSNVTLQDYNLFRFQQQSSSSATVAPTMAPTRINLPRGDLVNDPNLTNTIKCIPNSCPNNMCPGDGKPRIPMVTIGDGGRTMSKMSTFVSMNWGNVLSPYWAARAMAEIGGYQYTGRAFGKGTWMEFLPTQAPPRTPLPQLFQQICYRCKAYEFFNKGECSEAWSHMAPVIQNETQTAIMQHSKTRASQEENEQIFRFFGPNDWLVYNRCCVFNHIEFAPGVIQTFDAIPSEGLFNVYIMMGRSEDRYSFCKIIVDESVEYMKKRNPAINITFLPKSSLFVDFSRLVYAPNVLVAGMGSSWALWSAVLANSNNIVAHAQMWSNVSMLPNRVTYLLDTPTLVVPEWAEGAPEAYGLAPGKFSNSTEDREKVLNYFRGVTEAKILHLKLDDDHGAGNHT